MEEDWKIYITWTPSSQLSWRESCLLKLREAATSGLKESRKDGEGIMKQEALNAHCHFLGWLLTLYPAYAQGVFAPCRCHVQGLNGGLSSHIFVQNVLCSEPRKESEVYNMILLLGDP